MSAVTRVLDILRQPGRSQIVAVGHLYNDTYQTLRLGPNRFLGVDELDESTDLSTTTPRRSSRKRSPTP